MAQPVRADDRQPGTCAGARHDLADAAGRQLVPRRQGTQEQGAAAPVAATVAAVVGDRLAHVDRQRQQLTAVALAGHHQLSGVPVDVVDRQGRHLAPPQPSRASTVRIAKSRRPVPVRRSQTGQHPRDFVCDDRARHTAITPTRSDRDRVQQRRGDVGPCMPGCPTPMLASARCWRIQRVCRALSSP